jgi:hypothetical protein
MTMLCILSTDQWIALAAIGVGLLQFAAIIFIGIWTIKTYHKITQISSDATIRSAHMNDESSRLNKLNHNLDKIVEFTIQYPYFEDDEYIDT